MSPAPGMRDERETRLAAELAEALGARLGRVPELAIVLGSGLSAVTSAIEDPQVIDARALPHYPAPAIAGHATRLVAGRLAGRDLLALAGRVHLYEGHPAAAVVRPVRALARLGVPRLLLTNAAGSLRASLPPGTLLLVESLAALMGARLVELAGPAGREAPALRAVLAAAAARSAAPVRPGTLACVLGPCYETAAEIRALRRLGADAVTMSTAPEWIAARREGMDTAVVSVLTNWATGVGAHAGHEEVTARAARAADGLVALLRAALRS